MTPHTKLIEALNTIEQENERARREFTNVSNNLISDALRKAYAAASRIATKTTEPNAAQSIRAEALEVLDQVEAVMSIVEPRSDKREYLETLGKVRAAIRSLGDRG